MPDYGELAANLIQKNFSKFGSFRTKCTYTPVSNSTYSPTTGNSTPVKGTPQPNVWFIFADFTYTQAKASEQEIEDEKILAIDKNAIVPSLDLNSVPKKGDIITDDSGLEWAVVAKGQDPKPAHYQLHIRPLSHA